IDLRINAQNAPRLPNTSSISFYGVDAATILSELDGIAVSAGAACHADKVEISHVIAALKVPEEVARGTIRFSVGRETSEQEVDLAAIRMVEVVSRLVPTRKNDSTLLQESGEFARARGSVRLTHFTRGLGCACKLPVHQLREVLKGFSPPTDPAVLVGLETSDDAAVYSLGHLLEVQDTERLAGQSSVPTSPASNRSALVQTVDFFTPIVDDPYDYGRVAAVNSLSDLYAMGAIPAFALVIASFPLSRLPLWVLKEMLRGIKDIAKSAGIEILGGHTVDGSEPLLGLSVTGFVQENRIVRNRGGKPGDLLYLTKPLGTGILSTALKQGLLNKKEETELVQLLVTLNDRASQAMTSVGVSAATDVTGFGLLGHLMGMLGESEAGENGTRTMRAHSSLFSARIFSDRVPFLHRAQELAASGVVPGGSQANLKWAEPHTRFDERIPDAIRILLADAQTSGGLLIAVSPDKAEELEQAFQQRGCSYWRIGELTERGDRAIDVF
ncbi:MAG: selenide, water dikinase SelD, partial [Spirochaetes bacterium]|nr:selenide, water dikinase SelD [Spirochaetota bacterium]